MQYRFVERGEAKEQYKRAWQRCIALIGSLACIGACVTEDQIRFIGSNDGVGSSGTGDDGSVGPISADNDIGAEEESEIPSESNPSTGAGDQDHQEEEGIDSKEDGGWLSDVAGNEDNSDDGAEPASLPCQDRKAGLYCDEYESYIECDGVSAHVARAGNCAPNRCDQGTGCVTCIPGQFSCLGDQVLLCQSQPSGPGWIVFDTCAQGSPREICNARLGACVPAYPSESIGDLDTTGTHFLYSSFTSEELPRLARSHNLAGLVHPVPKEGHRAVAGSLYVTYWDADSKYESEGRTTLSDNTPAQLIDVYEIDLIDSDGDGLLEPSQHPDSRENPGPVEERRLRFVRTIHLRNVSALINHDQSELYVTEDRIYFVGPQRNDQHVVIAEIDPLRLSVRHVSPPHPLDFLAAGSLAYDPVSQIWYLGSRKDKNQPRRIWQWSPQIGGWGEAFSYSGFLPAAQGLSGLEVVVDPRTNVSYIYAANKSAAQIGQYRFDSEQGWVQENSFELNENASLSVSGMGFGPLSHFWVSSGLTHPSSVVIYEFGGGDMGPYLEKPTLVALRLIRLAEFLWEEPVRSLLVCPTRCNRWPTH